MKFVRLADGLTIRCEALRCWIRDFGALKVWWKGHQFIPNFYPGPRTALGENERGEAHAIDVHEQAVCKPSGQQGSR